MQQLLRPPGQRVATAQPLAALPLTDAACPLRASGTRGKRSWSNAFLQPDAVGTRAAGINCQVSAAPRRARRTVLANPQAPSHADPRTATLHACAKLRPKRSFLLDRARPVFFSTRWKRKWGGASPLDKPPAGADTPLAAVRRPLRTLHSRTASRTRSASEAPNSPILPHFSIQYTNFIEYYTNRICFWSLTWKRSR